MGADKGLRFKSVPVLDKLPTNYIRCIYQDKDGYIWLGTPNGLFMYNGYKVIPIRAVADKFSLPDNEVLCIAEDDNHCLWVGTRLGLGKIDKTTWHVSGVHDEAFKNVGVQQLLKTTGGELWIGTEKGLYYHDLQKQSFHALDGEDKDLYPRGSIIAMHEDRRGDVWIGLWNGGLWRYDKKDGKFILYAGLGEQLNVSAIYTDRHDRVWIGTWGKGLALLENPDQTSQVAPRYFTSGLSGGEGISDNYICAIGEDGNSGQLWVGTRSGLSVSGKGKDEFVFDNYLPAEPGGGISYGEVYSILCDKEKNMWLGMYGGGVNKVDMQREQIKLNSPQPEDGRRNALCAVRSILADDDGMLWLGSGVRGVRILDRNTGEPYEEKELERLLGLETNVPCIMQSPTTGKIWLGTYGEGVWIYDKKAPDGQKLTVWDWFHNSWIGSVVNDILEDSRGNYWFASNTGLSMLDAEGGKHSFASCRWNGKKGDTYRFCKIMEDCRKRIWVASDNNGVIRIGAKAGEERPDTTFYLPDNGKLATSVISSIYEDRLHRVWALSEVQGLFLYEESRDAFLSVNESFGLPAEALFSIEEDDSGYLWLGTNVGLVKLYVPEDLSRASYHLYTTADGLQKTVFNRNVSFRAAAGELFFGCNNGYYSFFPDSLEKEDCRFPVIITDIKIFNRSWRELPEDERNRVSSLAPEFTRKITLDYKQNNFNIEFAALKFSEPDYIQYAYRLAGMDSGWLHTDGRQAFACYNNLKPGKYVFYLKANSGNGGWTEPVSFDICILPPPWQTWWAYTIYTMIVLLAVCIIFRTLRNRMALRDEIRLRKLENAKTEELNHAKLQFFTNITHELLTPLAIISAVVDNQKQGFQKPEYNAIISDNTNRLIRLIQQILEFRKTESGHLKLRVSQGNLALFIRNCVDSIRPFAEKKGIDASFQCDVEILPAYFDPDKVDKIMYNLLSNAIKYNHSGGFVCVKLEQKAMEERVLVTVADNGIGMTPEQQKKLFSFFYEGDYRRLNTTGTGIGLALTKNLVNLHRGTIRVESEPDKGTSFEIELPVAENAFDEEEVDPELMIPSAPLPSGTFIHGEEEAEETGQGEKKYSILVVEDEVELLNLMKNLLEVDYRVFTAENGRQGMDVLKVENIDLVISDVMMPEMDGIEFCQAVKTCVDTCDIPVILLTAKNQQSDRIEAYDSGANAFISKPFNLSVLHSRISNLLKAREQMNRNFKKQFVFEAKELEYTSMDEDFLKQAFACIHEHLDDADYSQNDFVRDMAVSRSTAFRKLKSLTGLTYTDFVKNVRLKAACKIMEEKKNVRISELAYAVGFNDPKYFSMCFKKEFGMNPSEYISSCP